MVSDYEEIRDFIFCITAPLPGTIRLLAMVQNITLPIRCRSESSLFKGHGALREGVDELFRGSAGSPLFEGMGASGRSVYSRRVESMDYAQIAASLSTAKAAIAGMVAHLPTHEEFLRAQIGWAMR